MLTLFVKLPWCQAFLRVIAWYKIHQGSWYLHDKFMIFHLLVHVDSWLELCACAMQCCCCVFPKSSLLDVVSQSFPDSFQRQLRFIFDPQVRLIPILSLEIPIQVYYQSFLHSTKFRTRKKKKRRTEFSFELSLEQQISVKFRAVSGISCQVSGHGC